MTAPKWAARLIQHLAPPGRADDAIGDLNEVHHRRARFGQRAYANLLTTFDALDLAFVFLRQRIRPRQVKELDKQLQPVTGPIEEIPAPDPDGDDFHNDRRWSVRRSLEGWMRDLTHATRALLRAPGFTFVTVVTLALAIGANTAIFSVINTVLLDPLGFPQSERLVSIRASAPGSDLPDEFNPGPEFFVQYRENADMLENLGMYRRAQTTVRSEDRTERLFVAQATPSMYTTLGVNAAVGRLPTEEDPSGRVAVMSHWMWETWFGSDPEVIGRSYEVSGAPRTIIGIMGPEFRFPDERTSLWIQGVIDNPDEVRPGNFGFSLVGRMAPGARIEELTDQLAVLASRLPERFGGPPGYAQIIAQHRPVVRSLEEQLVGDIAGPLWLLLGTVAVVLLIACANVANLFIVRAESRRRDLAVRQALGAGRSGLIRIQMSEAIVLAVVGGVVGVLIAWIGLPLLVHAAPESIPNLSDARLDSAALLFTAVLAVVTACAFGLGPAIRFSRPQLVGALRQAGRLADSGSHVSRNALVLVQTASALVLLVGSGLLMRSFWELSHVDPGYDTKDIFSFQIAPDRDELNDGPTFAQFHQGFMDQLSGLPGVESVGLTLALPLDEGAALTAFSTEAIDVSGDNAPIVRFTFIGGDYFETMGITLLRGRRFERPDQAIGRASAIVSTAAAELFWPGEDPIGKRLRRASDSTNWHTVIGVVEDILLTDFRQDAPDPMVYLPMVGPTPQSWAVGSPAYVVRSPRADVIASDVRNLIREAVPESPMYRVFTMEGLADRSMAQLSFTMLMLAIASGLALVLGAVGLYGVLSYVVTHRAPEIAVRMALGAEALQVRRMVVMQGARVTMAGVAVGLMAALLLTRLLDTLLFGVGKLDALTFVGMSGIMILVALLASYIPARRASALDPMESLRSE